MYYYFVKEKHFARKRTCKVNAKKGWNVDRIQGSHYVMKKGKRTEVVPAHSTDLPVGLLKAILKRIQQNGMN
jgi:predicted RNA binding protein YcfA (HicA-like mRNA interferase family)